MAARRPRTSGRVTSKNNPGVVERDEDAGERGGKLRKRKMSDMLGPPWSKDDLEQFYQAYRKFGKDWSKVAGSMSKRTVEMVEALYSMNKAYLSLPEATTSPEVLIAMMTDHYNILEERRSEEDEESSEEFANSDRSHQTQSHQTSSRLRARVTSSSNPGTLSYGGPSPAKKPRSAAASRPRIVGKRTPRYPNGSALEPRMKTKVVANKALQEETSDEDYDFSKAAQTLVTASQRAASPLVAAHTPSRRNSRAALQNGHSREAPSKAESGGSGPKHTASNSGEVGHDGSHDSKERRNKGSRTATADETDVVDGVKRRPSDGKGKWKKPLPKRLKLQKLEKYDDAKEECSQSGTQDADTKEEDEERQMSGQKKMRHLSQRTKKRSRQLFSGGADFKLRCSDVIVAFVVDVENQSTALDTLATLADLSLAGLLPSPTGDSDPGTSSFREKIEDKILKRKEFSPPKCAGSVASLNDNAEKREDRKEDAEEERGIEESEKDDSHIVTKPGQLSASPTDSRKRKRMTAIEKMESQGKVVAEEINQRKPDTEVPPAKIEISAALKPRSKPKRTLSAKGPLKQGIKANKTGETSGVDQNQLAQGHGQSVTTDEGTLPLKLRSKKKGLAEKGPVNRFKEVSTDGLNGGIERDAAHCPHATADLGAFNTKARLIHCLSPKVRRWCMFEWFYSAIDLPWFARNEFVEYLNHAGLGHVPRLTRVEWGVIRSSLGKPRRLSQRFLQEEREKLEAYRESVRTHYHELRGGLREGLNSDLARPLTDTDAMPVHPLENMPEMMRRKRIILDPLDRTAEDLKHEAKRVRVSAAGAARAALNERLERPASLPGIPSFSPFFLNNLTKRAQDDSVDSVRLAKAATNEAVAATKQAIMSQPCTPGQSQARETDIRTLVDLGNALNKKEALVVELRRMNDEAVSYKGSDMFQRQYATIILQLKEVNEQVYEALKHLRHRNKYEDSALPPWHRPAAAQATPGRPSFVAGPLEPGPPLPEVAASAKKHAKALVSVAMETLYNCKYEEANELVSAALASVERKPLPTITTVGTPKTEGLSGASTGHSVVAPAVAMEVDEVIKPAAPPLGETVSTVKTEDVATKEPNPSSRTQSEEDEYLTDLMANCVTTLMMVQTLTEGQFSPAEVIQTLDTALESLRPRTAQNHLIFKEIEQQLGYVKTQILTPIQIPIQSGIPSPTEGLITQPKGV
ncbi:hypothetical protein AXG93_209s1220 [Marchantia polymorpha subsp. ruderalis]|uniref:SANT domain-containing protein n=1 Tax=Marchantia polymorpha subsp. ruderalis TaxID=1480154 RepID=A0A176VHG6_MARPO|nr:hypothetical protein AXG93_209s1220 [Marchantia polymorpha subsp. ruderalis]